jgi:hypothetical protein
MRLKSLVWGWKWGKLRYNCRFWRISSTLLWGHFTPNKRHFGTFSSSALGWHLRMCMSKNKNNQLFSTSLWDTVNSNWYTFSASLHSGLVGCVSRRSWEDTDTHQAGCKNLLSDFRIGKVCGYHKKPGILSLFWPTVDWGVLSCLFLSPPFWKPVSLSADISISDQAWQKLARRTAALCLWSCTCICVALLSVRRHGLHQHHPYFARKYIRPRLAEACKENCSPFCCLWSCTCICVALPRA